MIILERIPESIRREESELWREFDAALPGILGALLDAISVGLQRFPAIMLEKLPRIADYARWAAAVEAALGFDSGDHIARYTMARAEAMETGLEGEPVAEAVRALLVDRPEWTGTATELLEDLGRYTTERIQRSKRWPSAANVLSGKLRRLAPALRSIGVHVETGIKGRGGRRTVEVRFLGKRPPLSPPSVQRPGSGQVIGGDWRDGRGETSWAIATGTSPDDGSCTDGGDGGDGGDVSQQSSKIRERTVL